MQQMTNQISLFDGAERLKIHKPIRLIELFAGIGSQAGNSIVTTVLMAIFGELTDTDWREKIKGMEEKK